MNRLISSALPLFLTFLTFSCSSSRDWRTATRDSANIAPKAGEIKEAIVQIYGARAYSWRGWFAVHCWISYKMPEDEQYKVAQVIGWRLWRHDSAIAWGEDIPDRHWWGSQPVLIDDIRGEAAAAAIPKIEAAIQNYPYAGTYRVWPGPNSNSFIAHIIREVPELTVELPPHAVGKDWLTKSYFFDQSQSGTGYQLSLFGLLGLTLGKAEGIELNLLGLNFGLDILRPAIKIPIFGRLGFDDKSVD